MNKFKSILMKLHGENKEKLNKIYVDRQVYISSVRSSEQPVEEERTFKYRGLSFSFSGTGFRCSERMIMEIYIPKERIKENRHKEKIEYDTENEQEWESIVYEDFILRSIAPGINEYTENINNDKKDGREKARFIIQQPCEAVLRRSGISYVNTENMNYFVLRMLLFMPLINGVTVNAKSGFKAVRAALDIIADALEGADMDMLCKNLTTYSRQRFIRKWLKENKGVAFIAEGSILPRDDKGGKAENALPFSCPVELKRKICFPDGCEIEGMLIAEGVTVITGGGYQGKSTILNALEMGIYNHLPGDGREFVITEESAVKVYAEDGRPITDLDISPFFNEIQNKNVHRFSTEHASGSVSQAANIVEAVYGKSRLLLIDEDTSATNFMIRDGVMRHIIQNEPIIPFTDRVRELYEKKNVSSILVIGGSGEYIKIADKVFLMDRYKINDITEAAKEVCFNMSGGGETFNNAPKESAVWTSGRRLLKPKLKEEFFIPRFVNIENVRYISINDYIADVTHLSAIISNSQLSALVYFMLRLLSEEDDREELLVRLNRLTESRGLASCFNKSRWGSKEPENGFWLEEVRALDLLMALCRFRNIVLHDCN